MDFAPSYVTDRANPTPALHAHMDNAVQAAVLARMLSNVLLWMVSAAKCILAGPPAKIPQYHSKKKNVRATAATQIYTYN